MLPPASTPADSGEDVTDFLRRIKELGDQRDREDTERTRKLEEDIMEGRRQREARRAERARSLSPEKQPSPGAHRAIRSPPTFSEDLVKSPSGSFAAISKLTEAQDIDSTTSAHGSSPVSGHSLPEPLPDRRLPLANPSHLADAFPNNSMPTRSGTLSWQQRPTSIRGPRSRPLSMVQKQASPEVSTASPNNERDTSRADIARVLAAKDPAFFRQTADRGIGSAAYRKSQLEDSDTIDHSRSTTPLGLQLHGLAREPSSEPEIALDSGRFSTSSPKTGGGVSILSTPSDGSPSTTAVRPAEANENSNRSRSRPGSPTKGMGSFVSSAMLRSDSTSKRWSAQPDGAASLSRADSNARARRFNRTGSKDGVANASSMSRLGNTASLPLEAASAPVAATDSRPGSRQGISIAEESRGSLERPESPNRRPITPNAERHSIISPPLSPSKRWSPTKSKSSWLESALGKPESPKIAPPHATRNQPAWLVDLNKNRQQRMSKDISAKEVSEVMSRTLEANKAPMNDVVRTQTDRDMQTTPTTQAPRPKPKPARLSEGLQDDQVSDRHVDLAKSAVAEARVEEVKVQKHEIQPVPRFDPNTAKPRPSTPPPKKDFRSSLKSTPASPEKEQAEPEFKSAFGKLKRTQTQNYVAPDVLKDNITAGKAALSITGGPQKSVHRDEFKESILERKKTMKESAPEPNLLHKPKPPVEKITEPLPEALAKRRVLGRNENSGNILSSIAQTKADSPSPERPTQAAAPGHQQVGSAPSKAHGLSTKTSENKLANRFNPGLANLIARGPGLGAGVPKSPGLQVPDSAGRSESAHEPQGGVQLQHMTKARARGPKRRAPRTNVEITTPTASDLPDETSTSEVISEIPKGDETMTPSKQNPTTGSKSFPNLSSQKVSHATISGTGIPLRLSNPIASKSEPFKYASATDSSTQSISARNEAIKASASGLEARMSKTAGDEAKSTISAKRLSSKSERPTSMSVKEATSKWGMKSVQVSPVRAESPVTLSSGATALSMAGPPGGSAVAAKPATAPKPTSILAKSSDAPMQPPAEQQRNASSGSTQSVAKSPRSQASEAEKILEDFFGKVPTRPNKMEFDTPAILAAPSPSQAKIKTMRKEIHEITADGKMTALASHQEYILYSEGMYVCTHVFGDQKGTRFTEVYLWIGRSVPDSAVEDVQIFAKRSARDTNGTLVVLRQGKETAAFMQAIGGILMTRIGSSRQGTTAKRAVMLCGRRYSGHVVFDEVEFALSSLTAGFVFICLAPAGKIYIWIGGGAHAEELGSARLITTDLGPAAEVVEVEEGKEGGEFISQFPAGQRVPRSAEHWKRKPAYGQYRTRLYRVQEAATAGTAAPMNALWGALTGRPSHADTTVGEVQVEEIAPFGQSDLEEEHIYVLDAFFEMYILPGALSGSKGAAFAGALMFAQDYGMMAASLEDRPFVPVSTVVMSGAPRDMKASFRAWDDGRVDSSALMGGSGSGRRAPLKIMGLSTAIAALRAD